MKNQKVDTLLGAIILIIIAITVGVFVWKVEKGQEQNETQNIIPGKINNEKNFNTSNNWTLVSHENFWNNPNIFQNPSYKFPNIKFSYPDNWKFACCNDMDYASTHIIYSSENNSSLPYIKITDYALRGCNGSETQCSLDKIVNISADKKYKMLTSSVESDKILPNFKIDSLNLNSFVYNKTEQENKKSREYLLDLGNAVAGIEFINYELLNEDFISNFLNRIYFENQQDNVMTTENVTFCGKTFKAEKITLNDVDVIKRIAAISQNNKFRICENIIANSNSTGENLPVKFFKQNPTDADYKDGVYFLNILMQFKIDLSENNIYILGGYDGEPTFLGKLK